ncbi:MAG: PAAR domain-containing protein [Isosphaeraceae bacterium]
MGKPAAKFGDTIVATDSHFVLPPSGPPAPVQFPFDGRIDGNGSPDVSIMSQPAATRGSTATNLPPHVLLLLPGETFAASPSPSNQATILGGSTTVNINGKPAARDGDLARTCHVGPPVGKVAVITTCTVFIGD